MILMNELLAKLIVDVAIRAFCVVKRISVVRLEFYSFLNAERQIRVAGEISPKNNRNITIMAGPCDETVITP